MKHKVETSFELFKPTEVENRNLASLKGPYLEFSEMTLQEREFLNGLVLRFKPQKLLELGVSAGSSSVILLNAMKKYKDAKLYAVDYLEDYYLDSTKKSGFIAYEYPELIKNWKMYAGGLAMEYLDEIGEDIDFCFIDTVHMNPGELFDTLMVLPYLSDEAIIVYHDVNLHTFRNDVNYNIQKAYTNNLLISAVYGKKIIQEDFLWDHDPRTYFPNMGAVRINTDTKSHAFEIFNLLTIKWGYLPSEKEQGKLLNFLARHYDAYLVDYAMRVFEFQRNVPVYVEPLSTKRIINKIATSLLGQYKIESIKSTFKRFNK